jgi:hypothetical protein
LLKLSNRIKSLFFSDIVKIINRIESMSWRRRDEAAHIRGGTRGRAARAPRP